MGYCYEQKDLNELMSLKNGSIDFNLPNRALLKTHKHVINENVMLYRNDSLVYDDCSVLYGDDFQSDTVYLNIFLHGKSLFESKNSKEKFYINESQIGIYDIKNMAGIKQFYKNENINMFSIGVSKEILDLPLNGKKDCEMIKLANLSPKSLSLARQIYGLNLDDKLSNIYLQSKVLELIFNEFSSLKTCKQREIKFYEFDKKAIGKAVEILEGSIKHPPTISELARMVSLNEFKLKYGFRKYHNSSVYQTLLHFRMKKAKELLKNQEFSISEIAKEVGYKHVGSFSSKFHSYFGVNPKKYSLDI